jgi:hypothetical protein
VREHREEPVQLAVEPDVLQDLGAHRFQAAVHIVQAQTRDTAGDAVEDPRDEPAREGVASRGLPASDEVVAFVELRQQGGDLRGIVLAIAVDRHDDVSLRLGEPRVERSCFPRVAAQADGANTRALAVQLGERGERVVGGAVVDDDHLPGLPERVERMCQLVDQVAQAWFLVVDGDDDRDHATSVPPAPAEPSPACRPG